MVYKGTRTWRSRDTEQQSHTQKKAYPKADSSIYSSHWEFPCPRRPQRDRWVLYKGRHELRKWRIEHNVSIEMVRRRVSRCRSGEWRERIFAFHQYIGIFQSRS